MSNKRKIFISLFLVFATMVIVYIFFVRDWYKPTFIDRHWVECTIEKINTYDNLTDICNDLMKDGDFFKINNRGDLSGGINAVNNYFSFSIVSNESSDKGFHNIGTQEDLNIWLEDEFGKIRPVFNLMCRNYSFEKGTCWISPNLRSKNIYGIAENNDDIVMVIFCEKFTITIEQSNWGGDIPFQRFFLLFYELLEYQPV